MSRFGYGRLRIIFPIASAVALAACSSHSQTQVPNVFESGAANGQNATSVRAVDESVHADSARWLASSVAYRVDPDHRGASAQAAPSTPLYVAWRRAFKGYPSYPVVAQGLAIVTVASELVAVNAASGTTIWSKSAPQTALGFEGPAYDNGTVYTMYRNVIDPLKPAVFAFDATSGSERWKAPAPGAGSFSSPPTASGGYVYASGDNGEAYGFNDVNGTLMWEQGVIGGSGTVPSVASDGVYFSYSCPQVYKFALTTGNLIWHHNPPCQGGGGSAAPTNGGLVYVLGSTGTAAGTILDAKTGTTTGSISSSLPVFAGSREFAIEASAKNNFMPMLVARDTATRKVLWSAQVGTQGTPPPLDPIVVSNVIYIAVEDLSYNVSLIALNATTGSFIQSLNLGVSNASGGGAGVPVAMGYDSGFLIVPINTYLIGVRGI